MGFDVGQRVQPNSIQRYADLGPIADVVAGAPAFDPARYDKARAFLGLPEDHPGDAGGLPNLIAIRGEPAPHLAPDDGRWRALFGAALLGDLDSVGKPAVRALQAAALTVIEARFTNDYQDDGALLAAVAGKLRHYRDVPAKALAETVFGGLAGHERQMDALQFVLRTFDAPEGDAMLRAAVLDKIGKMGTAADVPGLVRFARKTGGDELRRSLAALRAITQRVGNPDARGRLSEDPEIGPLLARPHAELTDSERTRIIEAVLARGSVKQMDLLEGGTNLNRVYFVTFAESLGAGGPAIRGVFKPELTDGRVPRANFSREVAVYEGLERVLGTGLVAPTVETMLERPDAPGAGAWLGSMQFMLPSAVPFGSSKDKARVAGRFSAFIRSPKASRELQEIRLLCFVCGSGDHFMNSDHHRDSPIYNYNNFMVEVDDAALHGLRVKYGCSTDELLERTNRDGLDPVDREQVFEALHIVPIDFGSSLGNLPEPIKHGVLPSHYPRSMVELLAGRSSSEAAQRVSKYVSAKDAGKMKDRLRFLKGAR